MNANPPAIGQSPRMGRRQSNELATARRCPPVRGRPEVDHLPVTASGRTRRASAKPHAFVVYGEDEFLDGIGGESAPVSSSAGGFRSPRVIAVALVTASVATLACLAALRGSSPRPDAAAEAAGRTPRPKPPPASSERVQTPRQAPALRTQTSPTVQGRGELWSGDRTQRGDRLRRGDRAPQRGDRAPQRGDRAPRRGDRAPRPGDGSVQGAAPGSSTRPTHPSAAPATALAGPASPAQRRVPVPEFGFER
jgi:hypothetical protein